MLTHIQTYRNFLLICQLNWQWDVAVRLYVVSVYNKTSWNATITKPTPVCRYLISVITRKIDWRQITVTIDNVHVCNCQVSTLKHSKQVREGNTERDFRKQDAFYKLIRPSKERNNYINRISNENGIRLLRNYTEIASSLNAESSP